MVLCYNQAMTEFLKQPLPFEEEAKQRSASIILDKIKAFFARSEDSSKIDHSKYGRGMPRRDFLRYLLAAGTVLALAETGLPVLAQDNGESGEAAPDNVTERERRTFVYPDDIRGNESFWGKDVLITIDDCNNLEETRKMFNSLQSRGLKATFFPNSNYLPLDNNEVVSLWREMYQAGFEIGYHTRSHEVTDFTSQELASDLESLKFI